MNYDNYYTNRYYNELIKEKDISFNVLTFSTKYKGSNLYYNSEDECLYYNGKKLFSIAKRNLLGMHNTSWDAQYRKYFSFCFGMFTR